MKSVILVSLAASITCFALPEKVTLVDGRILEKVTALVTEDGRLKITHSGGTGRYLVEELSEESKRDLKLTKGDSADAEVKAMKRLETTDGKVYEDVRSIRIKPSFISFVHKDGATSVRFEKLSEEIRKKCGYNKEVADRFDEGRKRAEEQMAKAERDQELREKTAAWNAETRKRRQEALNYLYFSTYGGLKYWSSDPARRDLTDALVLKDLMNSGFSREEALMQMDRARFR